MRALAGFVLGSGLCLFAGSAAAQTMLHLTQTETVSVRPDRLAGVLRAEQTDGAASAAQNRVNAMIADALAAARQVDGVTPTTEQYSVWRKNDVKGQPGSWLATQSISVHAADGAALLGLVGTLQRKGLVVERLGWELAPDTARSAEEQATLQAVKALRGRADVIASAVDLRFSSFKDVTIGASPRPMPVRARAMAADPTAAAFTEPNAARENVDVTATVEAEIQLRPR